MDTERDALYALAHVQQEAIVIVQEELEVYKNMFDTTIRRVSRGSQENYVLCHVGYEPIVLINPEVVICVSPKYHNTIEYENSVMLMDWLNIHEERPCSVYIQLNNMYESGPELHVSNDRCQIFTVYDGEYAHWNMMRENAELIVREIHTYFTLPLAHPE